MNLYIVHAFTPTLFGGNPAGVVLLGQNEPFPKKELCIKIAADLRYSETVFVKAEENREQTFEVRYYTPTDQVELCGHATIGAFQAMQQAHWVESNGLYHINTGKETLPIQLEEGFVWMTMGSVQLPGPELTADQIQQLYKIMGTTHENEDGLPLIVSTGLPDIMMPLSTRKKLEELAPDFPALAHLSETYGVTGVHAFTLEGHDATAHTRNFAPLFGIDEEAATGTASGALTYYLYHQGLLEPNQTCLFIQGEAMSRPSRIQTRLREQDTLIIEVGGTSSVMASGTLHI
ncbi:MAG: PhzF family phenazine biosynthesis protein [Bacteroidia bacterium]|nr:PhzF family phenazine biosynthesis protein [Bacteroidia bacterium]